MEIYMNQELSKFLGENNGLEIFMKQVRGNSKDNATKLSFTCMYV